MRFFTLLVLLVFILIACLEEDNDFSSLKIATFNIEWLGDGNNDRFDRTPEDYKLIAEVIKTADLDVIGLQEIENKYAMDLLIMHLPKYDYHISQNANSQNLAVLFKKNIDIKFIGDYMPVAIERGRHRPGFVIEGKKGNFDWIMMIVHFKASSRWDNTPEKKAYSINTRKRQAEIVNNWVDSVLSLNGEKDIFIIGDLNDTPKRKKNNTIKSLINNEDLRFLTEHLKSCKYKGLYIIDHIVCSEAAYNRFIDNSQGLVNHFSMYNKAKAERISDHCLVVAAFEVKSPDND